MTSRVKRLTQVELSTSTVGKKSREAFALRKPSTEGRMMCKMRATLMSLSVGVEVSQRSRTSNSRSLLGYPEDSLAFSLSEKTSSVYFQSWQSFCSSSPFPFLGLSAHFPSSFLNLFSLSLFLFSLCLFIFPSFFSFSSFLFIFFLSLLNYLSLPTSEFSTLSSRDPSLIMFFFYPGSHQKWRFSSEKAAPEQKRAFSA